MATLLVGVAAQRALSTSYGVRTANLRREGDEIAARLVVHLDKIPAAERACSVDLAVWNGDPVAHRRRGSLPSRADGGSSGDVDAREQEDLQAW